MSAIDINLNKNIERLETRYGKDYKREEKNEQKIKIFQISNIYVQAYKQNYVDRYYSIDLFPLTPEAFTKKFWKERDMARMTYFTNVCGYYCGYAVILNLFLIPEVDEDKRAVYGNVYYCFTRGLSEKQENSEIQKTSATL